MDSEGIGRNLINSIAISASIPHLFTGLHVIENNIKSNGSALRFSEESISRGVMKAAKYGFAYKTSIAVGAIVFTQGLIQREVSRTRSNLSVPASACLF